MNVHMHAGLTCGGPNVYSNVVTVRGVPRMYKHTRVVEQLHNGDLLEVRHLKKSATCRRGTTIACPRLNEFLFRLRVRQFIFD